MSVHEWVALRSPFGQSSNWPGPCTAPLSNIKHHVGLFHAKFSLRPGFGICCALTAACDSPPAPAAEGLKQREVKVRADTCAPTLGARHAGARRRYVAARGRGFRFVRGVMLAGWCKVWGALCPSLWCAARPQLPRGGQAQAAGARCDVAAVMVAAGDRTGCCSRALSRRIRSTTVCGCSAWGIRHVQLVNGRPGCRPGAGGCLASGGAGAGARGAGGGAAGCCAQSTPWLACNTPRAW